MSNRVRNKANDVLRFAHQKQTRDIKHCLKQVCGDVDPITLQSVARSLRLFYSVRHDQFFYPLEFLQAFSKDEEANKAHYIDALWIPEVKREMDNILREMRADEIGEADS